MLSLVRIKRANENGNGASTMRFRNSDSDWFDNGSQSPWRRFFQRYYVESLFVIALLITAVLGPLATHPGVHLAGVTVLIDILIYKQFSRRSPVLLMGLLLVNVLNLIIILVANDAVELWFCGLYGVFTILLVGFGLYKWLQ